ncbi:hypothetical protein OUZ56_033613, partial [Daphnia magna]
MNSGSHFILLYLGRRNSRPIRGFGKGEIDISPSEASTKTEMADNAALIAALQGFTTAVATDAAARQNQMTQLFQVIGGQQQNHAALQAVVAAPPITHVMRPFTVSVNALPHFLGNVDEDAQGFVNQLTRYPVVHALVARCTREVHHRDFVTSAIKTDILPMTAQQKMMWLPSNGNGALERLCFFFNRPGLPLIKVWNEKVGEVIALVDSGASVRAVRLSVVRKLLDPNRKTNKTKLRGVDNRVVQVEEEKVSVCDEKEKRKVVDLVQVGVEREEEKYEEKEEFIIGNDLCDYVAVAEQSSLRRRGLMTVQVQTVRQTIPPNSLVFVKGILSCEVSGTG